MLITTTDTVSGKAIVETLGYVKGSTIRAKNVGKDILAGLKHLVGGEIREYQQMMTESRKIAVARMVEDAEAKGANAIIGMRLSSSMVMSGASEVIAYGTAVKIEE